VGLKSETESPAPIPLRSLRRLILGHASATEMRASSHKLSFRGILRGTRYDWAANAVPLALWLQTHGEPDAGAFQLLLRPPRPVSVFSAAVISNRAGSYDDRCVGT
jgi:hypothetical protein